MTRPQYPTRIGDYDRGNGNDSHPRQSTNRLTRIGSPACVVCLLLLSMIGPVAGFATSGQSLSTVSTPKTSTDSRNRVSCQMGTGICAPRKAFLTATLAAKDDFLFVDLSVSDPLTAATASEAKHHDVPRPESDDGPDQDFTVEDCNDNPIREGDVVRVVSENTKAYQVPPKFHGYFDEDGTFVNTPNEDERAKRCFRIPVGLRGVVTRLYDIDDISANHPIRVKFVPGEHVEEKDSPVTFIMHFSSNEVELVDPQK